MAHVIDSRFFSDGYSTPAVRAIFSDEGQFERWLSVEAALAEVQGELGVIPADAAAEIVARCRIEELDLDRVREGIRKTDHSLVPLLREIQRVSNGNLGEFVHYGATTQDIEDTGAVLQMRDVLDLVQRDVKAIAELLADLADAHRSTVMPGRTHGQHALVTTFGYRVAVWLCEVTRHLERLRDMRSRVLVVALFGGVGTMSALPRGIETMTKLAERLGLSPAIVSWHTARDTVAEYVSVLAMVAATIGKICGELYSLAKTEFGEVSEPHSPGKVGSSTMPHKRNPETCEQVAMLGRLTKYQAAMALEGMVVEHDRDGRAWRMEWISVPEVSCYTAAAAHLSLNVLRGLEVHTERMAANLRLQKDFLFSEALMLELGQTLGKQTAHHIVYEAAMDAHEQNCSIIDRLLENSQINASFDREALESVTDPARHLGEATTLTDAAVESSRRALEDL